MISRAKWLKRGCLTVIALVAVIAVLAGRVDVVRQELRWRWDSVWMPRMRGTTRLVSFESQTLHEQRSYYVYLPPSYHHTEKRYPVFYVLHGMPWGRAVDWIRYGRIDRQADEMVRKGQIPELLLVIPDGRGNGFMGDSEYVNARDGSCNMGDFFIKDLIPHIDRTYRTIPDRWHRAIGGISAGGFGGVNLGLKHPDLFGILVSNSGVFRAERDERSPHIWGNDAAYMRANSPRDYLPKISKPQVAIYLDVGTGGRGKWYLRENRRFHQLLLRLGIPHEYHEWSGPSHSWDLWRRHVPDVLRFVSCHWGKEGKP